MDYNGQLYGKWRGKYIPLENTAEDVNNMYKDIESLLAVVQRYEKALIKIKDMEYDVDTEPDDIAKKALNVRVTIKSK